MSRANNLKVKIGISIGDYNGIGIEVIIKTLKDHRILELCTPIIYGTTRILSYYKKALKVEQFTYATLHNIDQPNPKTINVFSCWNNEAQVNVGVPTEQSGKHAVQALTIASQHLAEGKIDALVTAPIHKENVQSEKFQYPGHTEFLAHFFNSEDPLMLMVSGDLRVGVATGHIPLNGVDDRLSKDLIMSKLRTMIKSLQVDFGISKPRIAVLGLNPHSGNNGLMGDQEEKIIFPAIEEIRSQKNLVYGPYAADGFFGKGSYQKFDAVLAMYHDQGLIPFKTLSFGQGVNYTAGLPIVRTSPDHGTGFDIAGKDLASPD